MVEQVLLELEKVRLDGGTQPRAQLDMLVISEYAQAMADGAVFPPVVVFYDGTDHWLADGFHRVHAARMAGCFGVAVDVRQGTRRDAVLHACGANSSHGLRRTGADKRRVVELMLSDPEWAKWSDREIARRCQVTHPFVSNLREEMGLSAGSPLSGNGYQMGERLVNRNGRTYKMQTGEIGKGTGEGKGEEQGETLWEQVDLGEETGEDEPGPVAPNEPAADATEVEEEATAPVEKLYEFGPGGKLIPVKRGDLAVTAAITEMLEEDDYEVEKPSKAAPARKQPAVTSDKVSTRKVEAPAAEPERALDECPGCHTRPKLYGFDKRANVYKCGSCGARVDLAVTRLKKVKWTTGDAVCPACGKAVAGALCGNCGEVIK